MTVVHVLNGPNLNLLGAREPDVYGTNTLDDVRAMLERRCGETGVSLVFKQSNSEGELVSLIQEAGQAGAWIILNAAAYTHTSIAIPDAIKAITRKDRDGREIRRVIEVHLSNVHARESFRHHSYISPAALGVIAGFGPLSYSLALAAIFETM